MAPSSHCDPEQTHQLHSGVQAQLMGCLGLAGRAEDAGAGTVNLLHRFTTAESPGARPPARVMNMVPCFVSLQWPSCPHVGTTLVEGRKCGGGGRSKHTSPHSPQVSFINQWSLIKQRPCPGVGGKVSYP